MKVVLSSGAIIHSETIHFNLKRIINQLYKLLPMREQGKEWKKPLETLIEELSGMNYLIEGQEVKFFTLLCKMKGLINLNHEGQLELYRRTIFQCLSLLNSIDRNVNC